MGKEKKKKEHKQRDGKGKRHASMNKQRHCTLFVFPNLYTIELSETILILSPIKSSLQNFPRVSWLGWNILSFELVGSTRANQPINQSLFLLLLEETKNITHADAAQSVAPFSSPEI